MFTDDGWSGTRWDRPSFTEMMTLVNEGKVGTIIVKEAYVKLKLKFCEKYFSHANMRTALFGASAVFTFIPKQIPKPSM